MVHVSVASNATLNAAWPSGELLCGGQRCEQRGEVGLGEEPAVVGGDEEVLGLHSDAHDVEFTVSHFR